MIMKRNVVKISVLAVVILGILGIAFYFISGVSDSKDQTIRSESLTTSIANGVRQHIVGKDYSEASKAYDSLLCIIKTESFITKDNGERLISEQEEMTCRKNAFDEYCKIFIDYSDRFFSGSSWNENILAEIKTEAQNLISTNLAENGTEFHSKLASNINNVNDYFAAWKVVRSASHCTSVSSVNNIKSSANSYMRVPLTNNESLKSGLASAYTYAKNSYANYVNDFCSKVSRNFKHYSSYDSFSSELSRASSMINDYIDNFGNESYFSNSKSILYNADIEAMEYFKSLEEDEEQEYY